MSPARKKTMKRASQPKTSADPYDHCPDEGKPAGQNSPGGIDTPETGQEFARGAKQAASKKAGHGFGPMSQPIECHHFYLTYAFRIISST
jgi:hypothetical protein